MENRVKSYREAKGLTQQQLAELTGVPQATISEIEAGKRTPGVDIAILLMRVLQAPIEELFIVH